MEPNQHMSYYRKGWVKVQFFFIIYSLPYCIVWASLLSALPYGLQSSRVACFDLEEFETAKAAFEAGLRLCNQSQLDLVVQYQRYIRNCEAELQGKYPVEVQ